MRRFIPPWYVWLALAVVLLVATCALTLWSGLATEHDGDEQVLAAGVVLFGGAHGGQPAIVLALGSILFACFGVVFASLGVDGAAIWRSIEATDIGYYVCLPGYASLIIAGVIIMATSVN